jgi:Tol biopolymer transport system component
MGSDVSERQGTKAGQRLAYTHFFNDWNIWRVDLSSARLKDAVPFITSTKDEYHPTYPADGRRIAFESNPSGNNQEIWAADWDDSSAVQLTSFGNAWAGSPRWNRPTGALFIT